MSRSTTLAIVHPVDKLQGSDDAVRTQVWAETTQLLAPMLGKSCTPALSRRKRHGVKPPTRRLA